MQNSVFNHRFNRSDRSDHKENEYGIPSRRKFPLNNASQVLRAEANFRKCPPEFMIQLAHNIVMKAQQFGIHISNIQVLEWASRW